MLTTDCPRLQPHDLEAEQAILGAVLLDPTALAKAQEHMTAGDFYDSRHRRIFDVMVELAGKDEGLDLLTLGDLLERNGDLKHIGGRGTLAELLTTVASASNVSHHARIVRDHTIRRRLILLTDKISQRAYGKDSAADLLEEAQRDLHQLTSVRDERSWVSLGDLACQTVEYVDQVSKRSTSLVGIPTGYPSLDSMLAGWQRSDLIILAARPSMGKTSLALGAALAAAKEGYRVGVISVEMSRRQVGLRLHGMGAPIDVHALRTGSLTQQGWWLLAETAQQFESLPLWIDDSSVLTVEQIAAKARQLQARSGLDLLVVDYLQLLELHHSETRQQGVADASRKLKLLAKELDIPVIVLSQLSRACEQREDKRPMLSDLRDSGAIEQDADVVIFLYRHEVYVHDTEEKGIAEVLIRKHRNGPIGDRRLRFVDRFARFEDMDPIAG
ncbi:MAG: replicative DNA helicase [Nitrospiraceae bacterium]|nr:MAG: replicative DNA helicase [Nitrospiraceae bacterium]